MKEKKSPWARKQDRRTNVFSQSKLQRKRGKLQSVRPNVDGSVFTEKNVVHRASSSRRENGKPDGRANGARRFEVVLAVNFVSGVCNYSGREMFFFSCACICDAQRIHLKSPSAV